MTKILIAFTFIGFIVGVTGAPAFLGTKWNAFQIDFFFWWSIFSTLMGLGFAVVSVWQYLENKNKLEKNKAQVKIWMEGANGIRQALQRIVKDNLDTRYSTTNDISNAVWSIEATAGSLYQSLFEERCVTEEEYRERQKKISELLNKKQYAEIEKDTHQTNNE